jgi:hypothetical protein
MLINTIQKLWLKQEQKHWYETYWVIDVHGTIIRPDHNQEEIIEVNYYPYAKECLQILTWREDIRLILHTSSYPIQIKKYLQLFTQDNIKFNYVNENPEISEHHFGYYEQKFYRDVEFEDKAGFEGETDWLPVYELLTQKPYYPNPLWKQNL